MSATVAALQPRTSSRLANSRRGSSRGGASAEVGPRQQAALRAWRPDPLLCGAVTLLLGLGLVLVYSSSSVYAQRTFGDAEHFVARQLLRVAFGVVVLVLALAIPSHWLERRCGWLFVAATGLCALLLLPSVGKLVGGARRWMAVGPVTLQPSELAKLAVVVLLAALLAKRASQPAHQHGGLLLPVLVAQIPVVFILAEPDLGTALVVELLVGVLTFAAGLRLRVLVVFALAALPVFYHLVVGTPFRLRRLLGYIDPWAYRSSFGYQVTEAWISIGSGGVLGTGLGEGRHKLFFLPEAHTDFIFAILGEELGLVGVLVLLLAFAVLLWRGMGIALRAATTFDSFLAVGLTALIGVPALFNMGVATGLLPTKGLPLPLVSYGGSNVVATLGAVGMLLRIHRDGCVARELQGEAVQSAAKSEAADQERDA